MTRWQRAAETAAIIASVALCVIVAGPGGALENLLVPLFGAGGDQAQRLTELAFGIPLAILLVPGLGLWAWGLRLRPAGAALTVLATLTVSVDLAVRGRLTPLAWALLSALWLLAAYQASTIPPLGRARPRPPALPLAAAASALPWVAHAGRLLLAQIRAGDLLNGDRVVVILLALVTCVLLALPVFRLHSFAPAGTAAAIGAMIYALMSLRWSDPIVALPGMVAVFAIAAAIAYVDTIWRVASPRGRGAAGGDSGRSSTDGRQR